MVKNKNWFTGTLGAASVVAIFATTLAMAQQSTTPLGVPASELMRGVQADVPAQVDGGSEGLQASPPKARRALTLGGDASQWGASASYVPSAKPATGFGVSPKPEPASQWGFPTPKKEEEAGASTSDKVQALAKQLGPAARSSSNSAVQRLGQTVDQATGQPSDTGVTLSKQDLGHMALSISSSDKAMLKSAILGGAPMGLPQSSFVKLAPFANGLSSPLGDAFGSPFGDKSKGSGGLYGQESQKKKKLQLRAKQDEHEDKHDLMAVGGTGGATLKRTVGAVKGSQKQKRKKQKHI
jgi:hypothetical protein